MFILLMLEKKALCTRPPSECGVQRATGNSLEPALLLFGAEIGFDQLVQVVYWALNIKRYRQAAELLEI